MGKARDGWRWSKPIYAAIPPPWACALCTTAAPEIRYGDAPQPYREPTQTEACGEWLLETLQKAGEPMRPKEVLVLAKKGGFKEGTIYRASKELEGTLVNTEGKKAPGNRWAYVG